MVLRTEEVLKPIKHSVFWGCRSIGPTSLILVLENLTGHAANVGKCDWTKKRRCELEQGASDRLLWISVLRAHY